MAVVGDVRQLLIIHLSDIHFGSKHKFAPPATAGGDVPEEREYPTLLEKLADDLAEEDPGCPVVLALTGDMAETGSYEEFKKAEEFVRGLTVTHCSVNNARSRTSSSCLATMMSSLTNPIWADAGSSGRSSAIDYGAPAQTAMDVRPRTASARGLVPSRPRPRGPSAARG